MSHLGHMVNWLWIYGHNGHGLELDETETW